MEQYIEQLLTDIREAEDKLSIPTGSHELDDWISEKEEEMTSRVRNLQEWTGISDYQLPPEEKLSEEQVRPLLDALKNLLNKYNCCFVLQTEVPARIQYETIRQNFDQEVQIREWHMGFFKLCKEGTEHTKCTLGKYCQCTFYAELFSQFTDEELSPEEERARKLETEISHLKRKHGDNWMKYYPYHLDASYDDENGNPYDYGFGTDDDDKDDW